MDALDCILDIEKRKRLFNKIVEGLISSEAKLNAKFVKINISRGEYFIPVLYSPKQKDGAPILTFIGAQHNEFSGLFGQMQFLLSDSSQFLMEWKERTKGGFCFVPLFNVDGFFRPKKHNKWGYFSRLNNNNPTSGNYINLNRYWNEVFSNYLSNVPVEHHEFGKFLSGIGGLGEGRQGPLYIIDFHETSLVYRYIEELALRFDNDYRVDHWIKKWIIDSTSDYIKANNPHFNPFDEMQNFKEVIKSLFKERMDKSFYVIEYAESTEKMAREIDKMIYPVYKNKLIYSSNRCLLQPYPIKGSIIASSRQFPWVFALEFEFRKLIYDLKKEQELVKKNPDYKLILLDEFILNQEITSQIIVSILKTLNKSP